MMQQRRIVYICMLFATEDVEMWKAKCPPASDLNVTVSAVKAAFSQIYLLTEQLKRRSHMKNQRVQRMHKVRQLLLLVRIVE